MWFTETSSKNDIGLEKAMVRSVRQSLQAVSYFEAAQIAKQAAAEAEQANQSKGKCVIC